MMKIFSSVNLANNGGISGVICLKSTDERNVCPAYSGGPVYSNATGTLIVVGVVSNFAGSKINASCQDASYVQVSQIGFYSANFQI